MPSGNGMGQTSPEPLLQVRDLQIALASSEKSALPVVVGASFDIAPKSITGILGESGSGKTTLALSLLGLLDPNRYSVSGSILLNGTELMGLPERQMERVRGAIIGIIPQDSLLGLNPVLRVQRQMTEAIRAHSACEAIQPEAALTLAGLEPSRRILNAYPHQLSGGERQRVSIALALASRPSLVIADEPFTALDGPRTLELASVFKTIREQIGVSFLLIDHSPGVMARIAEQALVMYAGRIVERGTPHQLLAGPLHPYTSALLRQWRTHAQGQEKRRFSIPGNPPALEDRRTGCPFEPRCDARLRSCVQADPPEMIVAARRSVRCFALDSEAGQQGGHAS